MGKSEREKERRRGRGKYICSLPRARTDALLRVALRDPKLRDPLSNVVSVIIALNAGARWLRSLLNYRLRSANNVPLSTPPSPSSPAPLSRPRTTLFRVDPLPSDAFEPSSFLPLSLSPRSSPLTGCIPSSRFTLERNQRPIWWATGWTTTVHLSRSFLLFVASSPETLFLFRLFAEYIARERRCFFRLYTIARLQCATK